MLSTNLSFYEDGLCGRQSRYPAWHIRLCPLQKLYHMCKPPTGNFEEPSKCLKVRDLSVSIQNTWDLILLPQVPMI